MFKLFKKKNKNQKKHKKSDVAIRYQIQISKPYGYYPEDVDEIIEGIEKDYTMLKDAHEALIKDARRLETENKALQTEITKLKIDMSLMPMPTIGIENNLEDTTTVIGLKDESPKLKLNL